MVRCNEYEDQNVDFLVLDHHFYTGKEGKKREREREREGAYMEEIWESL